MGMIVLTVVGCRGELASYGESVQPYAVIRNKRQIRKANMQTRSRKSLDIDIIAAVPFGGLREVHIHTIIVVQRNSDYMQHVSILRLADSMLSAR